MGIIWTIIIGALVGFIAKWIMPGSKEPSGFIVTTILGIAGMVLATWLGQLVGWYGPEDNARFIGGIIGAIIILAIYGFITSRKSSRY